MDAMLEAVEDVTFLRFAEGGRVHVFDRSENRLGVPLYQVQVAACGRAGRPGQLDGITVFDDRELCARCWSCYPADLRHRLFEHLQP